MSFVNDSRHDDRYQSSHLQQFSLVFGLFAVAAAVVWLTTWWPIAAYLAVACVMFGVFGWFWDALGGWHWPSTVRWRLWSRRLTAFAAAGLAFGLLKGSPVIAVVLDMAGLMLFGWVFLGIQDLMDQQLKRRKDWNS